MGPLLVMFRVSLQPKVGKISNKLGAGPGPGCPTSVKIAAKLGEGTSQDLGSQACMRPIFVNFGLRMGARQSHGHQSC